MATDPDHHDLFVSYAREDNKNGYVTAFIAALQRSLDEGITHTRLLLLSSVAA